MDTVMDRSEQPAQECPAARFVRRDPTSTTWHIAPLPGADARCGEARPRRGWWDVTDEKPAAWALCVECSDQVALGAGDGE